MMVRLEIVPVPPIVISPIVRDDLMAREPGDREWLRAPLRRALRSSWGVRAGFPTPSRIEDILVGICGEEI